MAARAGFGSILGQGSPATVSKAEIEAVCTAYVTAHTCFGGLLRPGRGLFWQQGQRPCSGLFWRCLPRRATALVEEPSEVAAEGFRVVRVLRALRLLRRG